MEGSLFEVMAAEGLTSLWIHYDWRADRAVLRGGREWDPTTEFAGYQRRFVLSSALTAEPRSWGDTAMRGLFAQHGQWEYLEAVIELMRKGRHCLMECYHHRERDIRLVSNVHNDTLGLNNRRHAVRAGGIRRHGREEPEYDVLVDGLNLGRGMSFKNAAARIPYGGSKFTVIMDPVDLGDFEQIGFLSWAVDRCRVFTGPDMGFPPELADVMNEHFTRSIVGGPAGPLGATWTPPAAGVFWAAKEAARQRYGEPSLAGRRVAVMGLGAVGLPLVGHYLSDGAQVLAADVDEQAISRMLQQHPSAPLEIIPPSHILEQEVALLSPCAVGGILDAETLGRLRCDIVIGAANNALRASCRAEELALAQQLADADVLYQVDWYHNMAGVICGAEEYERQGEASMEGVLERTRASCAEGTRENLRRAERLGITPTESAYRAVEQQIYGE